MRRRFLELALLDTVFILALLTLGLRYHGRVHLAGNVAIAAVLAVFCLAAGYALLCAYGRLSYVPEHLELAIQVSPMIAMLGTISGFLIAFSGAEGDLGARALGASTGLASTFVGVSSAILLMFEAHLLRPGKRQRACGCK